MQAEIRYDNNGVKLKVVLPKVVVSEMIDGLIVYLDAYTDRHVMTFVDAVWLCVGKSKTRLFDESGVEYFLSHILHPVDDLDRIWRYVFERLDNA